MLIAQCIILYYARWQHKNQLHKQQVNTLLDIISRQPDSAFAQFLDALKAISQHEAAAITSGDSTIVTKSEAPSFVFKTPFRRPIRIISELPNNITFYFRYFSGMMASINFVLS